MKTLLVSALVLVFLNKSTGQREIGDLCTLSSGKSATCELLENCTKAKEDLKKRIYPLSCGFDGLKPIVCCENFSPATVDRSSPKPPVTSTRVPGQISLQKCRDYANYTIVKMRPPILLIDVDEEEEIVCDHQVVQLIVGGEKAKEKEFPHMAALGYENGNEIQWLCGGSIISPQFILTAGHCLFSPELGEVRHAKMGMINLQEWKSVQQLRIIQRIPHPEYRSKSHYNDIALVKLEKPATMSPWARPACLYPRREMTTQRAIATGYGKTIYAGVQSDDLLKVTLDLFSKQTCENAYKRNKGTKRLKEGIQEEQQFCAGAFEGEKDTCQGDSGGPLQIYHINDDIYCMYDIIGVTSFGKICNGDPGVYTRVSNYIEWIESKVWPQ